MEGQFNRSNLPSRPISVDHTLALPIPLKQGEQTVQVFVGYGIVGGVSILVISLPTLITDSISHMQSVTFIDTVHRVQCQIVIEAR